MNYDNMMMNIINNMGNKKKLLLHSCCAPCSSAVIFKLNEYFDITVYYYNPNIDTLEEYNKRKEEQKRFIKEFKTKNKLDFIDCDYDQDNFLNKVKGLENEPERGSRCPICFKLRLESTAKKAKELGYDYFATTLTLSPYKNSKQINEIGLLLESMYDIKYLVSDFKKHDGYQKSVQLSSEYNLYRQDYCGCKFSKNKS